MGNTAEAVKVILTADVQLSPEQRAAALQKFNMLENGSFTPTVVLGPLASALASFFLDSKRSQEQIAQDWLVVDPIRQRTAMEIYFEFPLVSI